MACSVSVCNPSAQKNSRCVPGSASACQARGIEISLDAFVADLVFSPAPYQFRRALCWCQIMETCLPVNSWTRFNQEGLLDVNWPGHFGHWPMCVACQKTSDEPHAVSRWHDHRLASWRNDSWDNKLSKALGAITHMEGRRELVRLIHHEAPSIDIVEAMARQCSRMGLPAMPAARPQLLQQQPQQQHFAVQQPMFLPQPGHLPQSHGPAESSSDDSPPGVWTAAAASEMPGAWTAAAASELSRSPAMLWLNERITSLEKGQEEQTLAIARMATCIAELTAKLQTAEENLSRFSEP